MRRKYHLNGIDVLMLGFDHELRRSGLAGNQCQILLDLEGSIVPAALRDRVRLLAEHYPLLAARRAGWLRPAWKPDPRAQARIQVRHHRLEPGLAGRLLNEPLRVRQGELIRFDLWDREDGATTLCFTWAHALLDAPGAEHLLALIGRPELPLPTLPVPSLDPARISLPERVRTARKSLFRIDEFCKAPPRTLGRRQPVGPARMRYRVHPFSEEETRRVEEQAARHCGALGAARYHAAVALVELHRLHERLGCASASYVLPIPVGLRPKGGVEPLFRNQVTMLMTQAMPGHLVSVPEAVARLKSQLEQGLRDGLLESGLMLTDLCRFLPLPLYMAILKQGLRGEICSLFYGDTAAVSPLLNRFLGAPIADFTHVAAVTPSPGLGVIFYTFAGRLRANVIHLAHILTDAEADHFAADLRARLLAP